jgi:hypothetical protein
MSKLLILGNSQTASLLDAYTFERGLLPADIDVTFYCAPGGQGPNFNVEGDYLSLPEGSVNPKYPPFQFPRDKPIAPLSDYDCITVSALGWLGGSIGESHSRLLVHGLIHKFGPKDNPFTAVPLTESFYREVVYSELSQQGGMQFLRRLRNVFKNKVIVQLVPLLSAKVLDDPNWLFNALYEDPRGAMKFFNSCRDETLAKVCTELSVELLPYPNQAWISDGFTAADMIDNPDGIHPNRNYAGQVLNQVRERLI